MSASCRSLGVLSRQVSKARAAAGTAASTSAGRGHRRLGEDLPGARVDEVGGAAVGGVDRLAVDEVAQRTSVLTGWAPAVGAGWRLQRRLAAQRRFSTVPGRPRRQIQQFHGLTATESLAKGRGPTRQDRRHGRPGAGQRGVVLDDVSKAIIEQLQEDGRRPYAAIGKAVGLSEAAVRQRVQRLLDAGVMQIVAVTDPLQVGFPRQAMIGITARATSRRWPRSSPTWPRSTTW